MKKFSSKRRVAVVAALVLLVLFLFRPGASRLKSRIIISLSAAVGRPVDLSSVHIRLMPRPGFDLENLVVYDDPSFGSEPMLRAGQVTADLRLSSLLRGRLEVAKLDLTEPSLNLVHHSGGGWNVDSLLEHSARMPLAPTGKARSEPRPSFPYIEGSSGRINFMNGPEKKPYALTNADFALWQESENAWGTRLKAQPFRSDMNLNDTGVLQVSGTWQRSENFWGTPLQFSVEWSQAQLGQVTKFFTGNDKGWRADLRFDATLTGTPAAMKISSTVLADDFRRYDITIEKSLRLGLRCDAEYNTQEHEFHGIACNAPVGEGSVTIAGEARVSGDRRVALDVSAQNVPATAIATLARRVKKDLPEDLAIDGDLQGHFSMSAKVGGGLRGDARAEIAGLRVSSPSEKAEMGPVTIPIILAPATPGAPARPRSWQGMHAEFGPFSLERGRPNAATVRGWADRLGYGFTVSGDADVGRTLRLARMFGLHAPRATVEGTANLNLQIGGPWVAQNGIAGFATPQIMGTAKLRNVRFGLRSAGEPVEISSAEMQLGEDAVRVGKLNLKAAGGVWKGSLEMPRGCARPEICPVHFQLNADQISLIDASAWAKAGSKNRPWYRVLGSSQPPSLLARVQASGRITADRFVLHGISASKVAANVNLNSGKLEVSSIDADLLGGKHRGKWQADFGVKPAICSGSGDLSQISLGSISKLMKDDWIAGSASATYDIHGSCAPDFWQSSEGTLQVNVADGDLPHLFLEDSAQTLEIKRLAAKVRLLAGKIEVSDGTLDSSEGKYEVSGTATFQREIDFNMTRVQAGSGSSYTVTGTLSQPHVAAANGTEQARLKP